MSMWQGQQQPPPPGQSGQGYAQPPPMSGQPPPSSGYSAPPVSAPGTSSGRYAQPPPMQQPPMQQPPMQQPPMQQPPMQQPPTQQPPTQQPPMQQQLPQAGPPQGGPAGYSGGRRQHARPGVPGAAPMQPGMQGAPGTQPPMPQQPQQPARRGIDPDAVPSPVSVEAADVEKYASSSYSTRSALIPPLPNTPAQIIDDGNCSPRVMRSAMYAVPKDKNLLSATRIPFTLNINPLADPTGTGRPVPRVDHGPDGPIRCGRCKAYINPGMKFTDGGRRVQCNFCGAVTDVPERYFCNVDGSGRRHDVLERPELCFGTVDYAASQAYCLRPPQPPSYLFMIDVTYAAVKSGLVASAAQSILSVLNDFPKDEANGQQHSEAKIGIVTFGGGVHFYNLTPGLGQPQMMVVTDVAEPFVPLKEGLFVSVHESREIIENLLSQLPHMFEHTRTTDSYFGSAIEAAIEAMESDGGRIIAYSATMPTLGPGSLKNREDFKLLGTSNEKKLFVPQSSFYETKSELAVKRGIAVDVFMCSHAYADCATVGTLVHRTGGSLIRFPGFQSHLHSEKMISDVRRIITRCHGFDAVMRVRTSLGLRPVEFYGAFSMNNTRDIEFAGIDEDKSVVLECKYDDSLNEHQGAAFQAALLYTSSTGERLIRVHTLMLTVGTQIADIFRATDMPTIINSMARAAVREARMSELKDLREQCRTRCIKILAAYRKHCAGSNAASGQLILPDCLKLLPLYTGCLHKLDSMRAGGAISVDERMAAIFQLMQLPVDKFMAILYPRLVQIDDVAVDENGVPSAIRPSYARMKEYGLYLIENGQNIMLWCGTKVAPSLIQQLLGAPSVQAIDPKIQALPALDNAFSQRVRGIVSKMRQERCMHMPFSIVKQRDPTEVNFTIRLIEDKTNDAMSYVDFLCAVHRDIQTTVV